MVDHEDEMIYQHSNYHVTLDIYRFDYLSNML